MVTRPGLHILSVASWRFCTSVWNTLYPYPWTVDVPSLEFSLLLWCFGTLRIPHYPIDATCRPCVAKNVWKSASDYAYCGQTAGWIRIPLGMEVGLGPGDIVLDRDPAAVAARKGAALVHSALFGSCLLWPKSWMDRDATWYGGRPRTRPHCVRWAPNSLTERGTAAPTCRPMSIHRVNWRQISVVAMRSPFCRSSNPHILFFGPLLWQGRLSQQLLSSCLVHRLTERDENMARWRALVRRIS